MKNHFIEHDHLILRTNSTASAMRIAFQIKSAHVWVDPISRSSYVYVENFLVLYECDQYVIFVAKDKKDNSCIFVFRNNGELETYTQEKYNYTENDIVDEFINGGNENVQRLVEFIKRNNLVEV